MKISKIRQLKTHLNQIGDKGIAAHSQRYFKTGKGGYGEGDIFLGIRVPVLRKLAKQYQDISVSDASQLLKSKYHEERLISLLILVTLFRKSSEEEKRLIYDLYLNHTKYINNWDLVDSSAEHIVGPYLMNRDKKPLYILSRSADLWERRIAMMSTFHFIKKNEFDDAMNIVELLLHDTEDLIHKAVGWMLREIGKRELKIEEEFLKTRYQQMPRTMLRYAIEKFPEDKRQQYLKGNI